MDGGHWFAALVPRECKRAHTGRILYGYVKRKSPLPSGSHDQLGWTDFELGLELDGAEVRGILVYEGQEWGRVVFDMLS
jgi:hypothetical protein